MDDLLDMIAADESPSQISDKIKELPMDSILGCFCKPKACHCDVIEDVWWKLHPEKDTM